jgi:hypothetical protein
MGVQANILINHVRGALAVPLTAIYSVGPDSYVFVRGPDDDEGKLRHVKVKLGAVNETHAQIVEGIAAGQDVKLLEVGEGQRLLEAAGIRATPPPSTQPADEGPPPVVQQQQPPQSPSAGPGSEQVRPNRPRDGGPREGAFPGGGGARRGRRGSDAGDAAPSSPPAPTPASGSESR